MADNGRKRKPLTPQERAHQEALKKIKRLNLKLSEVHKLSLHMEAVSKKGTQVTQKQLEAWVKHLQTVLNKQDPKED